MRTEKKNSVKWLMSRSDLAEELVNLKKQVNRKYSVWGTKRMKKNEQNLRDLKDTIKHINICIIGVTEGKKIKIVWRNNGQKLPQMWWKTLTYKSKKFIHHQVEWTQKDANLDTSVSNY